MSDRRGWGWLAIVALGVGCPPGSGFDDRPPTATDGVPTDGDADADADADSDTDSDTDADTAPTGETGQPESGDTGLPPPGAGVVNEVLASPPTDLAGDANCDGVRNPTDDEFVELVNVGATPLALGGGQLLVDGALRHTFGAALEVPPGGTLVVFGGGTPTFDGTGASGGWCGAWPGEVVAEVASTGALQLPNTGGIVRIDDGYGRTLNEVTYGAATVESQNRRPELQDTPMVPHTTVPGALGAFSPGTLADGAPILGGPDETGDTGLPPFGTEATLVEVQTGVHPVGTEVIVTGVVTAVAADGVYLADPAGGPHSGVWVLLGAGYPATWGAIAQDDQLEVIGQVQEPLGNTTIDLTVSAGPSLLNSGPGTPPAPVLTDVDTLIADPEPWEGVLVELGPTMVAATGLAGNEFEVEDLSGASALAVDDQIALYSGYAGLVVGARFDAIRGPLYEGGGTFHLAPRSDADLEATPALVLRINEILGDPPPLVGDANCDGSVDPSDDDFVEIWNLGGEPVPLAGLTLSDAAQVRHSFVGGAVLAPGDGVVVFGGGSPTFDGSGVAGTWCTAFPASVLTRGASSGSLGITNAGDTLTLASGLVVVDAVTFGPEIAQDRSLNRDPDLTSGALALHDGVAGAVNLFSPGTLVDGVAAPYRASIVVDGDPSDFPADAAFTTSASTAANLAWSDTTLYVSLAHPAVGQGPDEQLVLYLGGGAGLSTTTGLTLGSQIPTLPFSATHAVRWSTNGSSDALATWNGAAWVEAAGWLGTNGSAVADDDVAEVVELAIPFAAVGVGQTLDLVLVVVDTTSGAESTVSAVPSTTITDGALDPNYTQHLQLHPHLAAVPNSYPPVP